VDLDAALGVVAWLELGIGSNRPDDQRFDWAVTTSCRSLT
jgi:hypothetical protein